MQAILPTHRAAGNDSLREQLMRAVQVLADGGIVAYPTESCFGLGCDPRDNVAIKRILKIKRRPRAKGLIVIADRSARLMPFLSPIDKALRNPVDASWPGPNTWLWPAASSTSRWLTGEHDTLAVRVTAHPVAAALCCQAKSALVSTSANRASRPTLRSARQVARVFGDEVDFVIDALIGSDPTPSRIQHCLTGEVIRL